MIEYLHYILIVTGFISLLLPSIIRLMAEMDANFDEMEVDASDGDAPVTLREYISNHIRQMMEVARNFYPDDMNSVEVTDDTINQAVSSLLAPAGGDIEEGGGGAPQDEGGDDANRCDGCDGHCTGGPQASYDTGLDRMAKVFNNYRYPKESYDTNVGISMALHSLRHACIKMNEIHPFGSVAAKTTAPAEDAQLYNEMCAYNGDDNSSNPQPLPPFNADEIRSSDIQEIANFMRCTIVLYKETEEDTYIEGRYDPRFYGGLGKYYSHVRAAMYLQHFETEDGNEYYELIFPKGCSLFPATSSIQNNTFDINNFPSTPVFTVDENNRITAWNKYCTFLTGIPRQDAEGHSVEEVLTQESGASAAAALTSVYSQHGDDPSNHWFIFDPNHLHNSNLQQLPENGVPLRDSMKIHKQYDAHGQLIGTIVIGQRRDAFGGVPYHVDYDDESPRPANEIVFRFKVHGDTREDARGQYNRFEVGLEKSCSRADFSLAYERICTEFDITPENTQFGNCFTIDLRPLTKEQAEARLYLIGGLPVWRQGKALRGNRNDEGSGYRKSRSNFGSQHQKRPHKLKHQQVDIDRAHAKIVADQNPSYNPRTDFDKDSTAFVDIFNIEKIRHNDDSGCGSLYHTAMDPCKTSLVHSSPQDIRDGQFAYLSTNFMVAKHGSSERLKEALGSQGAAKWQRYQGLNGRPCIMPPCEFSPAFYPSFLVMSSWERKMTYLHIGSGMEAAFFHRHHKDDKGPRYMIHDSFERREGRKCLLYVVHHSDAARHYSQTGGLNREAIASGCERLGNGIDAMPVYAIFEVDWNYYYGSEYATITKFFDRYNYCEPTCIDLNDFSAKWEFEFTNEESNYVAIL